MELFPIDWLARDVDQPDGAAQYTITVFGKTPDARSVAAHITFYPYMYVQLPAGAGQGQARLFITEAVTKHRAIAKYCRVVERVSLWGFTNMTKVPLAQLAFPTMKKMRWAARTYQGAGLTTYESGVDPLLRFFHIRGISPVTWIAIADTTPVDEDDKTTRAALEVTASFDRVSTSARTERPPLVIASWDLETHAAKRPDGSRKFPCADNDDDVIIQVATSFQRYGEAQPYRTLIMAYMPTDPVEGVDVVAFDDEADMINAWCDQLAAEDVDILIGYNTDQFDFRYLYGRSLLLTDDTSGDSRVQLGRLGRMLEGGGALRERELNSGAYGQNKFATLATPGILQLDLLQVLRKEYRLDSYSLNAVSKHFLGDAKVDLPAWQIFEKFEGTAADRAVIAEYAAKDTVLPLRLLAKLCILENTFEMANATFCPLSYVIQRGQQIKVYSVLMRKARAMGYACPDNVGIGVQGKFTGATVLNADRGAYLDDIVSGLDFASLYPSIIRGWTLDFSTLVIDPKYADVPGVEYYDVDTDQGHFKFAQGHAGVLPELLKDLATFRKSAKKKMAEAKARGDTFAAALHNGEQLAFKVTMNSAYGFTGATKGFLSCVPIAASVTATGRQMIAKTKGLVEQMLPGSRVVYGDTDSVMCILNLGADNRQNMAAHMAAAQKLADDISKTFPPPVELEFEKCYFPYLLFSKKRYAGLMYTKPDTPDYIDVKGLQLVRRDNCPLVKDVSNAILDKIMYQRCADLAIEEARASVLRVLRHQEPLDKFVVSKALRSDYKNTAQPHLYVAKKITRRTGQPVPSGARVPFVFVADPANPDGLLAERAEDPEYVREHGLDLDVLHYVEHQLESPITALLELLVDDPTKEVFGSENIAPLMEVLRGQRAQDVKVAKRIRKNVANNQREITAFFSPAR